MMNGLKSILRKFLLRILSEDLTVTGKWSFAGGTACGYGVLGGAKVAQSSNLEDLLSKELYNGYGIRGGSIALTEESLKVPAGWYNFLYIPHRTGNGLDNMKFGTLLLFPMTSNSSNFYIVHRISGANYDAIAK